MKVQFFHAAVNKKFKNKYTVPNVGRRVGSGYVGYFDGVSVGEMVGVDVGQFVGVVLG